MELKDVKTKINNLISAIGDLSASVSQVEKILNESLQKKDESVQELERVKKEIEGYWREHNKNKDEVFASYKKEKDESNILKNEANALIKIAQRQTMEAESFLESAKQKEKMVSEKLKEVESLKAELEDKVSKARNFAQTFK